MTSRVHELLALSLDLHERAAGTGATTTKAEALYHALTALLKARDIADTELPLKIADYMYEEALLKQQKVPAQEITFELLDACSKLTEALDPPVSAAMHRAAQLREEAARTLSILVKADAVYHTIVAIVEPLMADTNAKLNVAKAKYDEALKQEVAGASDNNVAFAIIDAAAMLVEVVLH